MGLAFSEARSLSSPQEDFKGIDRKSPIILKFLPEVAKRKARDNSLLLSCGTHTAPLLGHEEANQTSHPPAPLWQAPQSRRCWEWPPILAACQADVERVCTQQGMKDGPSA